MNKKDHTLKMRIDEQKLINLEKMAKEMNVNKSEMLRQSIPNNINTKMFNNMLSLSTLNNLEDLSKKCVEELNENKMHNYREFIEKYPVYMTHIPESTDNIESTDTFILKDVQTLSVKYPTYKIRLLKTAIDVENRDDSSNIRRKITFKNCDELEYNPNEMFLYETQCVYLNDIYNPIYLHEFLLLLDTLKNNEDLLNRFSLDLKNKGIEFEVWPGYYLKNFDVRIESIDNEIYIINNKFLQK